jgi:hypothetical protein
MCFLTDDPLQKGAEGNTAKSGMSVFMDTAVQEHSTPNNLTHCQLQERFALLKGRLYQFQGQICKLII